MCGGHVWWSRGRRPPWPPHPPRGLPHVTPARDPPHVTRRTRWEGAASRARGGSHQPAVRCRYCALPPG
eukprot:5326991-Prymnesium_polylepis.1